MSRCPQALKAVCGKSLSGQTLPFVRMFELYWSLILKEVTRVIEWHSVWCSDLFSFSLSSLFSLFFLHASSKSQRSPSIFFKKIWSPFFWLLFVLSGIIYKIKISFQSHHLQFFRLSNLVFIFYYYLFCLR
jgi:hypothetical protein